LEERISENLKYLELTVSRNVDFQDDTCQASEGSEEVVESPDSRKRLLTM
jgi:hypothetical protein